MILVDYVSLHPDEMRVVLMPTTITGGTGGNR